MKVCFGHIGQIMTLFEIISNTCLPVSHYLDVDENKYVSKTWNAEKQ